MRNNKWTSIFFSLALLSKISAAQQCDEKQVGGAICANGVCCNQFEWCGSTDDDDSSLLWATCGGGSTADDSCKNGCQISQCVVDGGGGGGGRNLTPTPTPTPAPAPSSSGRDVASIISSSMFDQMLKYRNDEKCPGHGFYTYNGFIKAARSFNGFGTTGNVTVRKREIAAFLGQTSHETTGGWASAPDGPYAWGYCYVTEQGRTDTTYYGRGPFQLAYDFNYEQAGKAIGVDLINNPDLVATDPTISFKTAIWFWMTPQGNKPSSHDVIVGRWTPSDADISARRLPGYGVITNIINGALECGKGSDTRVADRIGFYKRYCDLLNVTYGDNLNCYNQKNFS